MSYSANDVKKLREETGVGIMECKKALEASAGDMTKAKDWIFQHGLMKADKKADRETKAGYIASYVHSNNQIAALVEVLCETDFVALNSEFQTMARDIAMQVTALAPTSVDELLKQETLKNPSITVEEMVKSLSGKIGEKFVISRITRFAVGDES